MDDRKDNIEFKLSQLLDGDLDPNEEALLMARLREDPELSRLFAGYKRLDEMLEDLAVAPELSEVDYTTQRSEIMGKLEKKALLKVRPQVKILRWTFGGALAAAAAVLLAIGATMFFQSNDTGDGVGGPSGPVASVDSKLLPPVVQGSVESGVVLPDTDQGNEVAMVQVRMVIPSDDEFMLASPEENPVSGTNVDIARAAANPAALPPGTVLMVQEKPVERAGFDLFDIH